MSSGRYATNSTENANNYDQDMEQREEPVYAIPNHYCITLEEPVHEINFPRMYGTRTEVDARSEYGESHSSSDSSDSSGMFELDVDSPLSPDFDLNLADQDWFPDESIRHHQRVRQEAVPQLEIPPFEGNVLYVDDIHDVNGIRQAIADQGRTPITPNTNQAWVRNGNSFSRGPQAVPAVERSDSVFEASHRIFDPLLDGSHYRDPHDPIACEFCRRALRSLVVTDADFRRQMLSIHACSECSVACLSMMLHIKARAGERPYECDQCPEAFDSCFELYEHFIYHLNGGV